MKKPILFAFSDLPIVGRDFVARVSGRGKAFSFDAVYGDCAVYGVKPGGLAGCGDSVVAAKADFKRGFFHVLCDIADEAETFEHFKALAEQFFNEACEEEEWDAVAVDVQTKIECTQVDMSPRNTEFLNCEKEKDDDEETDT